MVRFSSVFVLVWTTVMVHSSSATVVVDAESKDVLPVAVEPSAGLRGSNEASSLRSNEATRETNEHDSLDRRLGTWADGTSCWLGSSCNNCVNPATWWLSVGWTACGTEPACWPRRTPCNQWLTCGKCCNDYNYYDDAWRCY